MLSGLNGHKMAVWRPFRRVGKKLTGCRCCFTHTAAPAYRNKFKPPHVVLVFSLETLYYQVWCQTSRTKFGKTSKKWKYGISIYELILLLTTRKGSWRWKAETYFEPTPSPCQQLGYQSVKSGSSLPNNQGPHKNQDIWQMQSLHVYSACSSPNTSQPKPWI